jgi:hypothetical protein
MVTLGHGVSFKSLSEDGDEMGTLCNGHRRRLRLKSATCFRSKNINRHQRLVRRPVTGFTSSIKPPDCPTEPGGELGMLMVTVKSEVHGVWDLGGTTGFNCY